MRADGTRVSRNEKPMKAISRFLNTITCRSDKPVAQTPTNELGNDQTKLPQCQPGGRDEVGAL